MFIYIHILSYYTYMNCISCVLDFDECEDENEEVCQHHAKKGMCEKSNNRYRLHCRKTCGLCGKLS